MLRFRLVPRLVPLGSIWFHEAFDVLFAALWLGSCLVPLGSSCGRLGFCSTRAWFQDTQHALFTALWLGSCLVPLGSSCGRLGFCSTRAWFQDTQHALFPALWLGSCLVPLGSSCESSGFVCVTLTCDSVAISAQAFQARASERHRSRPLLVLLLLAQCQSLP